MLFFKNTPEILRVSGLGSNHNFDPERIELGSPSRFSSHHSNGGPMDLELWSGMQTEVKKSAIIASRIVLLHS